MTRYNNFVYLGYYVGFDPPLCPSGQSSSLDFFLNLIPIILVSTPPQISNCLLKFQIPRVKDKVCFRSFNLNFYNSLSINSFFQLTSRIMYWLTKLLFYYQIHIFILYNNFRINTPYELFGFN